MVLHVSLNYHQLTSKQYFRHGLQLIVNSKELAMFLLETNNVIKSADNQAVNFSRNSLDRGSSKLNVVENLIKVCGIGLADRHHIFKCHPKTVVTGVFQIFFGCSECDNSICS